MPLVFFAPRRNEELLDRVSVYLTNMLSPVVVKKNKIRPLIKKCRNDNWKNQKARVKENQQQ